MNAEKKSGAVDFWGFGRDVSAIKKGPEAKGNRTLLHNFKGKN
ncbi:MAG: hypothetical protein Q4A68_09440 [Anaerobiospirillum succiniciproducens]|nr:hypothetical protein [Anaerobiospirillum succiniciproducens]MDO4676766.1 hypothetical protein [Anaerobiospirillum succiniciproducens]